MKLATLKATLAGKLNDSVETLESFLLTLPQRTMQVTETIKNGMYMREITIPADSVLTGGVWLDDYIDVMVSGHIIVATPDGVKELTGYNVCDGAKGRKRAGYAIADTKWLSVHRLPEEQVVPDMDKLAVKTMQDYRVAKSEPNRNLPVTMLPVITELKVPVEVKQTSIGNLGLFASCDIPAGAHIGPYQLQTVATDLQAYCNYSLSGNVVVKDTGPANQGLFALVSIKNGQELFLQSGG